jgi:hemerythrin-like metal-binding protein
MDISFEWDRRYSVGHPVLDAQRRTFLELRKRAFVGLDTDSDEGREEFHRFLHDLSVCVSVQIRTEESVLAACGYARLDEHLKEHTGCLERITDFLVAATQGTLDVEGVQTFLTSWWENHLLKSDMEYAPLLRGTPLEAG